MDELNGPMGLQKVIRIPVSSNSQPPRDGIYLQSNGGDRKLEAGTSEHREGQPTNLQFPCWWAGTSLVTLYMNSQLPIDSRLSRQLLMCRSQERLTEIRPLPVAGIPTSRRERRRLLRRRGFRPTGRYAGRHERTRAQSRSARRSRSNATTLVAAPHSAFHCRLGRGSASTMSSPGRVRNCQK